jgi:hypothetical protein
MKTILFDIPSSELPALLTATGSAYYWRPAAPKLMVWDGTWQTTDLHPGDSPQTTLPRLTIDRPILFNGLLDNGFTPQLTHQIIDAHLQDLDQEWIFRWPRGEIPHDLQPFVQPKTWPLIKPLPLGIYRGRRAWKSGWQGIYSPGCRSGSYPSLPSSPATGLPNSPQNSSAGLTGRSL